MSDNSTFIRYTGTGIQTRFRLGISSYNKDTVTVTVDSNPVPFTFVGLEVIEILPAPVLGSIVEIRIEAPASPAVAIADVDYDLVRTIVSQALANYGVPTFSQLQNEATNNTELVNGIANGLIQYFVENPIEITESLTQQDIVNALAVYFANNPLNIQTEVNANYLPGQIIEWTGETLPLGWEYAGYQPDYPVSFNYSLTRLEAFGAPYLNTSSTSQLTTSQIPGQPKVITDSVYGDGKYFSWAGNLMFMKEGNQEIFPIVTIAAASTYEGKTARNIYPTNLNSRDTNLARSATPVGSSSMVYWVDPRDNSRNIIYSVGTQRNQTTNGQFYHMYNLDTSAFKALINPFERLDSVDGGITPATTASATGPTAPQLLPVLFIHDNKLYISGQTNDDSPAAQLIKYDLLADTIVNLGTIDYMAIAVEIPGQPGKFFCSKGTSNGTIRIFDATTDTFVFETASPGGQGYPIMGAEVSNGVIYYVQNQTWHTFRPVTTDIDPTGYLIQILPDSLRSPFLLTTNSQDNAPNQNHVFGIGSGSSFVLAIAPIGVFSPIGYVNGGDATATGEPDTQISFQNGAASGYYGFPVLNFADPTFSAPYRIRYSPESVANTQG